MMTFDELQRYLSANKIVVALNGNDLTVHAPEGVLNSELKRLIALHEHQLASTLRKSPTLLGAPTGTIRPAEDSHEGSPLSWFQERMWLHHQRAPKDLSYNIPVMLLVHGELDVQALEKSLSTIVRRHQSLRTYYSAVGVETPLQFVAPPQDISLPVIDVEEPSIIVHVRESLEHHFDLSCGPVFVARLLRLDTQKHLLLLNIHHIAADAWSIQGIFLHELQQGYQAFCTHQVPTLPPLTIQYKDYAYWQRTQDVSAHVDYWKKTLAAYEDTLELPADRLRTPQSGRSSATFVHRYTGDFALKLERFSRQHHCTVFMSLLAALSVTVSRYTGREDLCIGTTTSGRSLVELEPLIGFFINILPLRLQVDEQASVKDLLEVVRQRTLAAFDHQIVPFEQILQATGVARQGEANPLVPIILRHQNFPHTSVRTALPSGVRFGAYPDPDSAPDEVSQTLSANDKVAARCEIELSYTGSGSDLEVEVVYASDLYERTTVERLLSHHERVLEDMFADDTRPLHELSLLAERDLQRLCVEYNRTEHSLDNCPTFVERFDTQVQANPGAVACYDQQGTWTYQELASQANRLAQDLIARGVRPGSVVGVCLDRGAELLISLLAIWRAGAAYVPLDPSYPQAYLQQIIADAAPTLLVSKTTLLTQLGLCETPHVAYDAEKNLPPEASAPHLTPAPSRDALAYVMYTSGSTGVPKGVRVPHRQLINWLSGIETNWPFLRGEVTAQKTTMAFAVSVKELFAGLLNGCPQAFLSSDTVRDTGAFVAALAAHHITRVNLVPSHLKSVLEHLRANGLGLPDLKLCITAGEPLTAEVVGAFRATLPQARLLNNYGCTELNDITYFDATQFEGTQGFVPIGKPIQNTKLFILDRQGRLVPDGVAGELHVATVGMADGYHQLQAMTAERFLPNRFDRDPSSRLYNTGDVVKYLTDGNLEFIGRWDFQVKIRGYRVDVRQVEKVLGDYPGMGTRAVVASESQLIAYYVAQPDVVIALDGLRAFLKERLPPYMVPNAFVVLSALPQLPNGKLNRRALEALGPQAQQSQLHESPANEVEQALAAIWTDVLNVPTSTIGRLTNFFEIGGHSLSATRVIARIRDKFGVELGLTLLFNSPKLCELAACVQDELDKRPTGGQWSLPLSHQAKKRSGGSRLLENRVVLVTGASRGIGFATARLLADNGAKVAINFRDSERQAQQCKELIEAEGGTAEIFRADVTQADQVARMVAQVGDCFGSIDVLVANASISFRKRLFVDYDWADLEQKVTAELKAVFFPCQAVVPSMLERRSGSIVAISSTLSKNATAGFVAQCTAKAALDSFVRTLAEELGPQGIRVNTVAPGVTLTDAAINMPIEHKQAVAAECPMGRNGLPDDMAGAVLFLASDLSRFMTGSYLPVDGGFTML